MTTPLHEDTPHLAFEWVREVARRRLWIALAAFSAPFAATFTVAALLPDLYRSTATIVVERDADPRPPERGVVETALQTLTQHNLSRGRLYDLIKRFDLYPLYRGRLVPEALVERMRKDIQIDVKEARMEGEQATLALAISYRGRDPVITAQVTSDLAQFYVDEDRRQREAQAAETVRLTRAQLDVVEERMKTEQVQVREFASRHVGELPTQVESNLAKLDRISDKMRGNRERQRQLMEERQVLDNQVAEMEGRSIPLQGRSRASEQLGDLQRRLKDLRARYTDQHPDVIRVKAEIAAYLGQPSATTHAATAAPRPDSRPDPGAAGGDRAGRSNEDAEWVPYQGTAAGAEPTTPPALLESARSRIRVALGKSQDEIRGLHDEEQQLGRSLASVQQQLDLVPRRALEMDDFLRPYEATRLRYQGLLQKYDEAMLARLRQGNDRFRIVDPALVPKRPVSPNRTKVFAMGLALSILLALGVALLAEQLDTSFHSAGDLRAFAKTPVLANVPDIVTPGDTERRRLRLRLAAAGAAAGLLCVMAGAAAFAHDNEALVWVLESKSKG